MLVHQRVYKKKNGGSKVAGKSPYSKPSFREPGQILLEKLSWWIAMKSPTYNAHKSSILGFPGHQPTYKSTICLGKL
jgi:hypothetical protein